MLESSLALRGNHASHSKGKILAPHYWGPNGVEQPEIRTGPSLLAFPITLLALGIAIKVMSSGWSLGDFVHLGAIGFGRILGAVFGR